MIPWFEPPSLQLGPVTLQAFGLLAALGVAVGVRSAAWAARRRGLDPRPVLDYAIWGVIAGIVAGHLVHVGLYHPDEIRSLRRVLEFWDGLSSFGGQYRGAADAFDAYLRLSPDAADASTARSLSIRNRQMAERKPPTLRR